MAGNVDLALAARLAGTSLPVFLNFNPAYRRPLLPTDSQGNSRLLLPLAEAERFEVALDRHRQAGRRLWSWRVIRVDATQRLKHLAKRLHVPEHLLRSANGLPGNARAIVAGSPLLVPAGKGGAGVDLALDTPAPRLLDRDPVRPVLAPGKPARHYQVKAGDSLNAIAQRFRVSVATLGKLNGLKRKAKPQPGSILTIAHAVPPSTRWLPQDVGEAHPASRVLYPVADSAAEALPPMPKAAKS